MSAMNDGGPAYPRPYGTNGDYADPRCYNEPSQGMSLRTWFAGQATEEDVQAHTQIWSAEAVLPHDTVGKRDRQAAKYHYADAMIAASGRAT